MNIEELRNRIDQIDKEIVDLLNQRCEIVQQVGEWKKEKNLPIFVPEREKSLLRRLQKINHGPLENESLLAIYREIISGSIRLELPLRVAVLGPEGTFSHQALVTKFGHGVTAEFCPTIGDVFKAVAAKRADYGMAPVENSTEGVVNHTLDCLFHSSLVIIDEFKLPVHHMLFANCKANEVKRVYSHTQVLGQCRDYLQNHFTDAERIEVASTAKAMEIAMAEEGSAAIAGKLMAEKYEVEPLATNVEDNSGNTTRFIILGEQEAHPTGNDKSSICFVMHDRPGALYDALRPFRNHNISMTLIESRPLKTGNWEYCFFVDIKGHIRDKNITAAFDELKAECAYFKLLGSYPSAE